jgi:aminoglycoside/choline kinase family phosphotransferase
LRDATIATLYEQGDCPRVERLEALRHWLDATVGGASYSLQPASADASFRRYFRARFADGARPSVVVMDAPPDKEDCRPFVRVAALLHEAGLNAPRVLAQDLSQGFLLLTDLGVATYLAALDAGNAGRLFDDATSALVQWQSATRDGVLPPYDAALLRRELDLFPQWYLERHLGLVLEDEARQTLERVFALLIASALAQPQVFVHRDYMPRNLMVCDPNPGILDFQDAVQGPITYDVVSLFRDAFISWDEERVLDWTIRYWEKARARSLPVDPDFGAFYRAFEWMGLQRHLKVIGIFARIRYRDGKPGYLEDAPRFLAYARATASRYAALAPLVALLDRIEGREAEVRYTF